MKPKPKECPKTGRPTHDGATCAHCARYCKYSKRGLFTQIDLEKSERVGKEWAKFFADYEK